MLQRCFFLLLICSCACPSAAPLRTQTANHKRGRALLVGINQYQNFPSRPTPGSEEDAQATCDFLIERFGFQRDEIKLLTGAEATARNIVDTFRTWLIAGTQPGDRVFFLYSGHGTRIADDNGDEADKEDEALAPYDVNRTGGNLIRDDVFNQLIGELNGRMVVMLFDSCHSGTITRAVPGSTAATNQAAQPKYLPIGELAAQTRAVGGDANTAIGAFSAQEARSRDLHLVVDRPAVSQSGVVIFTAAQANQRAYPVELAPGKFRGALSYVFNDAQSRDLPTLRELKTRIGAQITALKDARRLNPEPVPMFELFGPAGLEDQPLFGAAQAAQVLTLGNPSSPIKLTLTLEQNKRQFKIGEDISYRVTSNTAGYLYLLVFSEKNVATCLLPNPNLPQGKDNALRSALRIPRAVGEVFQAIKPIGKDIVIALLSQTPLALGEKEDYTWDEVFERLRNQQLFALVKDRQTAPINQRSVGTQKTTSASASNDWQAVSLVLETVQ